MAGNGKDGATEIIESLIGKIDDPFVLAGIAVAVTFIFKLPEIIRAGGETMREGRKNKVEVRGRQGALDSQVKSLEDKRLRKKRRS